MKIFRKNSLFRSCLKKNQDCKPDYEMEEEKEKVLTSAANIFKLTQMSLPVLRPSLAALPETVPPVRCHCLPAVSTTIVKTLRSGALLFHPLLYI